MFEFFKKQKRDNSKNVNLMNLQSLVLRDNTKWDVHQAIGILKQEWEIEITEVTNNKEKYYTGIHNNVEFAIFSVRKRDELYDKRMAYTAVNSPYSEESLKVFKEYSGYIKVVVRGLRENAVEIAKLQIMLSYGLVKQQGSLAVYNYNALYIPAYYINSTNRALKVQKSLPLTLLVQLYEYKHEDISGVSTIGLSAYGNNEFEIYCNSENYNREQSVNLVFLVISNIIKKNTKYEEGSLIKLNDGQKLKVIKSEGLLANQNALTVDMKGKDFSILEKLV